MLLCVFPNSTTLIDSSLQNWILISRQLPKQFTTEQNIRIMVGIIKTPMHSNIVSSSIAPTHNWVFIPTKKQLYDQRASICEPPSADSSALVPSRSGKAKNIPFLILLFFYYFTCAKTKAERSIGVFPQISTSKKFPVYFWSSLGLLVNAIVENSEAVEEGMRDRRMRILIKVTTLLWLCLTQHKMKENLK